MADVSNPKWIAEHRGVKVGQLYREKRTSLTFVVSSMHDTSITLIEKVMDGTPTGTAMLGVGLRSVPLPNRPMTQPVGHTLLLGHGSAT